MARKYEMKRRARRQEETRRRITEATVELHQALGPANTTISAIAERAGVQRLTVYRHFPDERAVLSACSSYYEAQNPVPDVDPWTRIPDPEDRLRRALKETYAYHRRTEPMMAKVLRDAQIHTPTMEVTVPYLRHWDRARYALVAGWGAEDQRLKRLLAALGHALDFWTWRSLVREQGLTDQEAIELMVGMVRSSMRD
ncbi:MAG: TetR/AcrR family transcriptional regulator [Actinomycetota bacterium]|nr:TetR/AcrR family transcriptional regulator [Actinomycetota bacterium]